MEKRRPNQPKVNTWIHKYHYHFMYNLHLIPDSSESWQNHQFKSSIFLHCHVTWKSDLSLCIFSCPIYSHVPVGGSQFFWWIFALHFFVCSLIYYLILFCCIFVIFCCCCSCFWNCLDFNSRAMLKGHSSYLCFVITSWVAMEMTLELCFNG